MRSGMGSILLGIKAQAASTENRAGEQAATQFQQDDQDMDDSEEKKRKETELLQRIEGISARYEAKVLERNLNSTAELPLCSFCGKGRNQVARLIQGRNAFICDSCIRACQGLVKEP